MGSRFAMAAVVALALPSFAASATTIIDNVTFSANFSAGDYGGGTSGSGFISGATPVNPVTGSFTITFDPTLSYTDDTADITNTVLNGIASDSVFAFDYYAIGSTPPSPFSTDELVVGGIDAGACCVAVTPDTSIVNDFYLQIENFTTSPAYQQFGYTQSAADPSNSVFFYTTIGPSFGSVTVVPQTVGTPVPEPGSLALFGAALAGFGFIRRRKARVTSKPGFPG